LKEVDMNKLELIKALKEESGLTQLEAASVIDMFFGKMANALAKGDRVEIRGLCSFYIKKYKAYAGRNPKTGEKVKIAPKKLPFFKCGKELKERVDY
jgi:integration host factor subunit beta